MKNLLELKNGSDIRGIALDTAEAPANLTPETLQLIAFGLIHWFRKNKSGTLTVGIGHDSRLSGPQLSEILKREFSAAGIRVLDFGLATTPALFMATQFSQFDCDFGVMLTASHLPYYYNGLKLFSKTGGAEKEDITFILTHTQKPQAETGGSITFADLLTPYAGDLVAKIRKGIHAPSEKPLSGMKIIVDAGNGAGGFFAKNVLETLGADTQGSQFLEPDGHFPNHIPNPDNPEAMASIKAAVLENHADLGVIFDTDVDRSAVVTASGEVLNRNNLIAVLSVILLKEHPGTRIVTNSPTTDHLKTFIERHGGKQVRYISGYRNVINKAIQLNHAGLDCQLAIETSGHAAFKENYFLDDGAYVIAKLLMLLPELSKTGRTLEDLIADLQQPAETLELRFNIKGADYSKTGNQVIQALPAFVAQTAGWQIDPENEEGIRVSLSAPYGSGWFLLRMSLHEPLLVLQVENDFSGIQPKFLQTFASFIADFTAIDNRSLTNKLS